ncbi:MULTISPECIES: N-acetyltransferase [Bacillus]|uniref:N-acetyltransferase n=1 Tax=Bacillus TaxID=1386 RepID=UPI0002EDFFAA|nr:MULTISPECIES: N-acetyltransferase [Bacillus]
MKRIREAKEVDMEVVYMMGYDVWGENISSQDYIAMCNESSKYKRGIWYALEESNTKNLLCSLIVYKLNPSENMIVRGIGSIATPKPLRNRGYASFLIKEVINQLERNDQCDLIFFV